MSVEYRAHVRVEHHGVAKSTLETIDLERFASTYIVLHCREEARERETARRYVYLSMLNAHDRDGERQRGKASIPLQTKHNKGGRNPDTQTGAQWAGTAKVHTQRTWVGVDW